MPLYLALAVPAIVAAVYVYFGWTRRTRWLATMAAASILVSGLWLRASPQIDEAFGGWLIARPETALLLIIVGLAATLAMAGFPAQLTNEIKDHVIGPVTARWYGVFTMGALIFAVITVTGRHPVISLAAIEIVVLATAGLVASRRKPPQKRAALIYGLSCTGGVILVAVGGLIPPGLTAMFLVVIGWATLAGLAPFHWWLPPTVSVASAPVAAFIAGVQIPLAWAALLRLDGPSQQLLIVAAPASVLVALAGLARQRDVRRLVAYLGIGLTGLLALALSVGAEALVSRLLLSFAVTMTVLYLAVGHVVSLTGSGRVATVRGLLSRSPLLGRVFGLGLFTAALLVPGILGSRLGWRVVAAGAGWTGAVVGVGLVAIAVVVAVHAVRMLRGDPADLPDLTTGPARPLGSAGPVLIFGIVAAVLSPVSPTPLPVGMF